MTIEGSKALLTSEQCKQTETAKIWEGEMTIEEKVREITNKYYACDNPNCGKGAICNYCALKKDLEAILELINTGESGVLQADEVTLEFFRKYLEMPNGTLEDLMREIIRLKTMKPMSREKLILIIQESELATGVGPFEKWKAGIKQLADAILAEWGKE